MNIAPKEFGDATRFQSVEVDDLIAFADALIGAAWDDAPLRDYLASICGNADVQAALQ